MSLWCIRIILCKPVNMYFVTLKSSYYLESLLVKAVSTPVGLLQSYDNMAKSYDYKKWDLLSKWVPDRDFYGWSWLTNMFWKLFILKLPSQQTMKHLDVILWFSTENILHCKLSFKVRHRIDQNLRTILWKDKKWIRKSFIWWCVSKGCRTMWCWTDKKSGNLVLLFN